MGGNSSREQGAKHLSTKSFSQHKVEKKYSFIADSYDSLEQVTEALSRAGLESSNLIVGIDFTKSNEWTGPTSFAPVIEQAMTIVEKSGGRVLCYYSLLDGHPGIRAMVPLHNKVYKIRKRKLPLSSVLVGVGDGPWDMMKKFDDNIPQREFDNFQFVNFTEIMSKNTPSNRKEAEFALSALMEVPFSYMSERKHAPKSCASSSNSWTILMWILGSLCDSLQEQVVTTPGNAKALRDHLKDLFHDNKNARAINLDNELRSIKIGKMTCEYTQQVWKEAQKLLSVNLAFSWNEIMEELKSLPNNQNLWSIVRRLVFGAVVYYTWQERNNRIFREEKRDGITVFNVIKETVKLKIAGLVVKGSNAVSEVEDRWSMRIQRKL
ncbi:E3 ubiquitin protein ligase RGLG2-like protein [Tanacetum coccineum]